MVEDAKVHIKVVFIQCDPCRDSNIGYHYNLRTKLKF